MSLPCTVNIELTSFCNKKCWMCGRRKMEKDPSRSQIKYGNMDMALLRSIASDMPEGIVIQFHNNGEPLLYPWLEEALELFPKNIRCMDTNGKLLLEKKGIINRMESVTVSTFENDPEADEQLHILRQFLSLKGDRSPIVVIRCLGDVRLRTEYEKLGCLVVDRVLHSPMGSFSYTKKPVIPEIGICLEMLTHPAINVEGDVSTCVRFDPGRLGVLGNVRDESFMSIWNGEKRMAWLKKHVVGRRSSVPLCSKCEFWGIPRG